MQQPITNPPVPYVGPVPGGLSPGTMVRIQGQVPQTADRFNINLHCGAPPSDTALHLSVRLLQDYIARNSLQNGAWGTEEDNGKLSITPGQRFEVLILCDPTSYKIAVNGNHFCEFHHRIPFQQVTHLAVDGDVSLGLISFEGGGPSAPEAPLMAGRADYETYGPPSGQYGPSPGQYGPPVGQYGPPPGQYGPPPPQGPYGPSPYGGGPGYGPPRPPGHQEESGLDSFLETAGTVIAGAISSGAAQSLLSSLTGSGGQAQQQRYQPPPPPPPPPQQPLFPVGGQGSLGNLGSVGSLLGSLADQVLSAPKKQQMPVPAPTSVLLPGQPPVSMPMPMPSVVPLPPPSLPPGAPAYMPPLPTAAPAYGAPPLPLHMPPYGPPAAHVPPSMPGSVYPAPPMNMPYGSQPIYPPQKMKKSKLKKAMKYGLPIVGAGVGAYAISQAMHHHHSSSSSSSSSSDSD